MNAAPIGSSMCEGVCWQTMVRIIIKGGAHIQSGNVRIKSPVVKRLQLTVNRAFDIRCKLTYKSKQSPGVNPLIFIERPTGSDEVSGPIAGRPARIFSGVLHGSAASFSCSGLGESQTTFFDHAEEVECGVRVCGISRALLNSGQLVTCRAFIVGERRSVYHRVARGIHSRSSRKWQIQPSLCRTWSV